MEIEIGRKGNSEAWYPKYAPHIILGTKRSIFDEIYLNLSTVKKKNMAIGNPNVHIICGLCGSNKFFEFSISNDIDDDYEGETEDDVRYVNTVYLHCGNCGTLTGLDELMKERKE